MKLFDLANVVETKGILSEIILCDAESGEVLVQGNQMYVSDDRERDFSRYDDWNVVSMYPQGGDLIIYVRKA